MLPKLVANLAFFGVPDQYPVYFVGTIRVGPTTQMPTRGLKVGSAADFMTANL